MFHRIIYFFYWLLVVVSLAILIACPWGLFSSFMNIACRSTQKRRAYQTLYKITHRYNWNHLINNQKNNHKFVIMLKRNSIKVHSNTWPHWQLALEMRTGWPYGWFWKFLNGSAKSPRLIVLNIDWVQFVLKSCEIPHSVRGLYDK